ncbi:RecA family ATPase, partial [Dipodascopsis tothii]|uniref:RecA family ATPase n=1 Tax=Dipodascopsis tothii TaxID=44089 RepID=UPI0034CDB6B5
DRLVQALEAASFSTTDLLTLEPTELARRCAHSANEIRALVQAVTRALQATLATAGGPDARDAFPATAHISTGDAALDAALGGGVPTGALTEIAGESAAGKSHLLMQLTVAVQLPPAAGGLGRPAIYVSTEAGLETRRLGQIVARFRRQHPGAAVSMSAVHCISCLDLESQDHILRYQLPVLVDRLGAGLVVVDSIASHYRVEYGLGQTRASGMHRRGSDIVAMAAHLRRLAVRAGLAVVVANQVSDRFPAFLHSPTFSLDYQSRYFSGFDWLRPTPPPFGLPANDGKLPALGLIWSNCVSVRVVLKRYDDPLGPRRTLQLVFSPYAPPAVVEFAIGVGGVAAVLPPEE